MAALIHNGESTHHQLHVITFVSLRTTKTTANKAASEVPDFSMII